MKIKQFGLFLLSLCLGAQAYATANLEDSKRCFTQSIDMSEFNEGCTDAAFCERKAFICLPVSWWMTYHGVPPLSEEKRAPVVLAFHGKVKYSQSNVTDPLLWEKIQSAPDAGMLGFTTNLHGAMPNAIVVYFQGLPINHDWTAAQDENAAAKARGWQVNVGNTREKNRDLIFVYEFYKKYLFNYNELDKLYAAGHSNGSRFAGVLWNRSSADLGGSRIQKIAFNAAQAGEFDKIVPDSSGQLVNIHGDNLFTNSTPRSILMSMGTKDLTVDFSRQRQSIAKAKILLNIPLDGNEDTLNPNSATTTTFTSSDGLKLTTYLHPDTEINDDGIADGHIWPLGLENMIADFFNLP